jgi:hypothetical protein
MRLVDCDIVEVLHPVYLDKIVHVMNDSIEGDDLIDENSSSSEIDIYSFFLL